MNRLNHEEIAEVARLVARRPVRAQGTGPTSQEVGAVLGLSSSEVEAMLHELRLKNGGAPLANPSVERRTIFLALGSVAALLIVAVFFLVRGVFLGGAPSAPVVSAPSGAEASVSGASTSPSTPSGSYPMGSSASAIGTRAPLAQNATEPPPSGLPPQIQSPGGVRVLTSGEAVRRAVESGRRSAQPERYAVAQDR